MTASTLNILLMLVGIGYGVVLIVSTFVSNKVTEMFRIDTFLPMRPTENTRKLNLLFGLFVIGSCVYSLLRYIR